MLQHERWLDDWLDIDIVNWEGYDTIQKSRKDRLCKEKQEMEEKGNGKERSQGKKHDKPSSGCKARMEANR